MADDSDIPPLEDMTEVLKQASAIRTGMLDTVSGDKPAVKTGSAKDRAKVKKSTTAKAVNVKTANNGEAAGDHKEKSTIISAPSATSSPALTTSSQLPKLTKVSGNSSGGMFGGLKKGFLFGSPSGSNNKNKNTEPVKAEELKAEKSERTKKENDIPFISPKSGKTQSDLTIDEVQQAMSEAKGLLENQDWVNDDLLDKVEKNELLLKRFADPHFMKALEEFQTNPAAAMEKYKGNKEVEKFLAEFCGLLGDHFTNFGDSPTSAAENKSSVSGKSRPKQTQKIHENLDKKTEPKIIELVDSESKSVQLEEQMKEKNKKAAKIIDLTGSEHSSKVTAELSLPKTTNSPSADVRIHTPGEQADIKEVPIFEDAKVKEVLNDPQVMEILLDPRIMNLIQLLQADYEQAQRIVDTADGDFREKIKFLMIKGLLQFQAG